MGRSTFIASPDILIVDRGQVPFLARARHRDGCNVLFLDYHSEYIPADAMTVDMWRDK
jgi:prepilin-type processing-associated H-X9-DG protein